MTTTAGSCFPLSRTFVSCTLGNLAAGESTTVTIELEPTTPGTISNTVIAAATNAPAVEDAVTTAVVPDLVIDKSANRDTTVWLASLSYTLRVTNQGPTTADNVIVTDGVPLGGVSVTSDDFTCEEDRSFVRCEGSLLAGETGTVEISGQVPQEVSAIENTAQVSVEGVSIVISEDTVETTVRIPGPGDEPGGEEPENDKGEWVLVNHKGKKELCLPKAALNGHLNHGDEVIDEEGCSNAEDGGRRGLR